MRIVFLGTPEIAVPTLDALVSKADLEVIAAITQPDRHAGRGRHMHSPPVKLLAQKHNIPVFQPEKLSKAADIVEHIKKLNPDLMVMVAFGQILKPEFLAIPKMGVINLHTSLLPAYRGAAPINWAILNGNTTTGISTMFTEAGLDTGPVLLREEIPIDQDTNAEELAKEMAKRGAALVIKTIEQLQAGKLNPIAQDDSKATYAPMLDKNLGAINWSQAASTIHNLVRGLIPWPGAFAKFHNHQIKIWQSQLLSAVQTKEITTGNPGATPGTIVVSNKRLFVACQGNTWLELKIVQPASKSRLGAYDWANGIRLRTGDQFTS